MKEKTTKVNLKSRKKMKPIFSRNEKKKLKLHAREDENISKTVILHK